jgi:hypothetical protein
MVQAVYICLQMEQIITTDVLARAMDFDSYLALTKVIVNDPAPTGAYSNEKTHRYTRSNLERMEKVLQNIVLNQKLYNALSDLDEDWVWVVLSEPWCGDASWGTTALYIISTASEHVDFKILLRDTNPDVMQAYQTNGGDAIPKLICLRKRDMKVLGTWGPRPAVLQVIINAYKSSADFDYKENVRRLHAWYEQDMTAAIQDELIDLVKEWKEKSKQ